MPFSVDDGGHSRKIVPAAIDIRSCRVDVDCEGVPDPPGSGAAAGEFGPGVGAAGAGLVISPGVEGAGAEFAAEPGVDTTAVVAVGPKVGITGAEFTASPGVVDTAVGFVVEPTT